MCFGFNYFTIPTFFWRLVASSSYDPTRWSAVKVDTPYQVFWVLNLILTSIFQLWFWIVGVRNTWDGCVSDHMVGFIFVWLPLDSFALRVTNITFQTLILIISLQYPFFYLLDLLKIKPMDNPNEIE